MATPKTKGPAGLPACRPRVLQDHRKLGSRLVPPLLQLHNLSFTSYVRDTLPEIVWLRLVQDAFGDRNGVELCVAVGRAAVDAAGGDKQAIFGYLSPYSTLDSVVQQALVARLRSDNKLEAIQQALLPLTVAFPQHPLAFLGPAQAPSVTPTMVELLRTSVGKIFDRRGITTAQTLATALYISAITGGIVFTSGVQPPDLNALYDAPESDEAQRSAGFLRAAIAGGLGTGNDCDLPGWPAAFWNGALHLDECIFYEEDDSDG